MTVDVEELRRVAGQLPNPTQQGRPAINHFSPFYRGEWSRSHRTTTTIKNVDRRTLGGHTQNCDERIGS